MSQINKTIYPDGTLYGDTMRVSANKLNVFVDNNPWEQSIAVSQSTADFAPFNNIDYFAPPLGVGEYNIVNVKKSVQKIGLLYISTGETFGNNQYYTSNVDNIDFSDISHIYYTYISLRKTGRGSQITQNIQSKYRPENYEIVTGLNLQNVLGVVCVGFSDGYYCSLKYYNDNYQTINKTAVSLFMVMFYGDTAVSNVRRCLAPVELEPIHNEFWRYDNSTTPAHLRTDYFDGSFAFPLSVCNTINPITAGHSLYKTQTTPSIVFPLIGFCAGTGQFARLWSTNVMNAAQGTPIYGGGNNHYYTLTAINNRIYPVLAQAAFDDVIKVAATYGLPFAIDFPTDAHSLFTSNITTFIPIANDGGYYNGRFETLTVNGVINPELSLQNLEQWNGGINAPYDDRSYNPDIPIPTDSIDLTQPNLTAIDAFNRTYIIDGNSVDSLGALLWSGDNSFLSDVMKSFELYGEKPINGIINLMLFPFDVRTKTGAAQNTTIKIGTYDTQIAAYRLPTNANAVYDFGAFKWEKEFDNFLDFEPFTTAELYVPFFGMFPLQNSHFIGKTIDIKVAVDFITGAATCIIYVSDRGIRHPVIYKNATLGVQVPITGDDVSGRVNTILNNAMGVIPDIGNVAKSAITGNIGGVVKSAISAEMHSFGVDAVPTMYQTAGSSAPECSLYLPKKPYIILYTPEIITTDNYNSCIGYATFEDVTIGNCHGFCKFDNIDLSNIVAIDAEKMQIANALTGGVYL